MHDKVGTVHVKAQNVEKITASIVPAKALRHKGTGKRKRDDGSKSEDGPAHKKDRKEKI